jgi:hypothetical protein
MRTRIRSILPALGLTLMLLPVGVSAAVLDGNSNLVCAAINVVGCTNKPGCLEGTAGSFGLPQFLFVDFKKQAVHATDESGISVVSPIRSSEISEKQIILQGIENNRGWNATIDRGNGEMAVTSSGSGVSFMIFGACTTR